MNPQAGSGFKVSTFVVTLVHCDSANRFQVLPYSFMVKEYSSPYNDLVTLTDGKFLKLCRSGRLVNQILLIDQPEGQLYHETSEKAVSST